MVDYWLRLGQDAGGRQATTYGGSAHLAVTDGRRSRPASTMLLRRLRQSMGLAIDPTGKGRYGDSALPSGAAEEALDCACGPYLKRPDSLAPAVTFDAAFWWETARRDRAVTAAIVSLVQPDRSWWKLAVQMFGISRATAHRKLTEWRRGPRERLHHALLNRLGETAVATWSRQWST